MNFRRKGKMIYQSQQAYEFIQEGRYRLAKIILEDNLREYPEDTLSNYYLSLIYRREQDYETALMYLLRSGREDRIAEDFVICYLMLNQEDKVYEMYRKYYYPPYNERYQYSALNYYLRCKYHNLKEEELMKEAARQIYSYDPMLALEHIRNRHYCNHDNASQFYEDIPLEETFYQIQEFIKENPKKGILFERECVGYYLFHYPNCGIDNYINHENNYIENGVCDYIMVMVNPFTLEIKTMYPTTDVFKMQICYLPKLSEKKILSKTGLERFQRRYSNFKEEKLNK